MRKSIVLLFASLSFMASNALATPVATVEAVQTAVKSVNATSTAMNGINAAAVTAAVANSPALGTELESLSSHIQSVAAGDEDVVNGMSKIERVDFLVDLYAATVLTKSGYDVVERLFKGKPLQAILGLQTGDDALDSGNLAKFKDVLKSYKTKVEAGEETAAAAESASQEVLSQSFQALLEACGAAGGRN